MKIRTVALNNHKKSFEVATDSESFLFPYVKADPAPSPGDPVAQVRVDEKLAREAFVFTVASGQETTVHIEQVLEYNQDPTYRRDLLLYKLTLEAQRRVIATALSRREIIRRLGTSPAQLYRLLDQTNYRKSVDHVLHLLHVLECDVDVIVRDRARKAVADTRATGARVR